VDRELEIRNLYYAIRLGLHKDPRWREAVERLWPDLFAEVEEPTDGS